MSIASADAVAMMNPYGRPTMRMTATVRRVWIAASSTCALRNPPNAFETLRSRISTSSAYRLGTTRLSLARMPAESASMYRLRMMTSTSEPSTATVTSGTSPSAEVPMRAAVSSMPA